MEKIIRIRNGKIVPNLCENEVKISGKPGNVDKFIKLVGNDFDFRKIIPMPEEIQNTLYPVCTEGPNANMTPERQKELMAKYRGADSWYDWTLLNWTTTGLARAVKLVVKEKNFCQFDFLTEGGPPVRIYKKTRELFPDLRISWFYNEPVMEIRGYLDKLYAEDEKQDKENEF